MATWSDIEKNEPELAARIQARFSGHPHHILGTIRSDGAPRLSGINVFFHDGYLWFGSMPDSRKAKDIVRDARVSLHSAPLDESMSGGDASISGIASSLDAQRVMQWQPESPANGQFFEVDVQRLHLVEVVGEELVVTMWDNTHGLRIVKRQ